MIQELANLLEEFPGASNQTWCFTHILNLIVKSILRQFDIPKAKADQALDDVARELFDIAENIDYEEEDTRAKAEDKEDDDNVEGWIDEWASMSDEDREELDLDVQPVQLVLTKVSQQPEFKSFKTQIIVSCARYHRLSRTHLLLLFHNGSKYSRNLVSTAICYPMMWL